MNRQKNGFTLLELFVVTVLLGILATLAHASYRDLIGRGQLEGAAATLHMNIQNARITALNTGAPATMDFDCTTHTYTLNGSQRVRLPEYITYGADPSVKGKPSQPNDPPPASGITFRADGIEGRAEFSPKGAVFPTGAVYLTNGRETLAITVALNGHVRKWRSRGGNKWDLL